MNKQTVTGTIVSKNGITLFFATGSSQVLPQDSYRTQDISDIVLTGLMVPGNNGVEIDLDAFSIAAKLAAVTGLTVTDNAAGGVDIKVGDKIVTDENLTQHVERAMAGEGAKGFANFMKKFAEIKRQHTADELLHFLKQADMPFADDGSILAYKALRIHSTDKAGNETMVDNHSKKVPQKLGSLVYMPDSKVDDNRRVACSTGLHIAAKSYLGNSWGGNTDSRLCIVKIQPKDVIAVPHNQSKMRVSAYHIIKVLNPATSADIANGNSIYSDAGAHLALEEAVGGSHTPILERVKVTGRGEIEITPVNVSIDRKKRKASKVTPPVAQDNKKKAPVVKVLPVDVNILKKLTKHSDLSKFDQKHIKKLVKAQKLLDKGESLRSIAAATGLDRDSLSIRLVRPKKAA